MNSRNENRLKESEEIVLKQICIGKTYTQIAKEVGLSTNQVKYIKDKLFKKFDVHRKIPFIVQTIKMGYIK